MDNVVELKFDNSLKSEGFNSSKEDITKSQVDAKVYAYHLYHLLEEYKDHFWNNYQNANGSVSEDSSNMFDSEIIRLKKEIGDNLEYLDKIRLGEHLVSNKEETEMTVKNLKYIFANDYTNILNWFNTIEIPFQVDNVISIEGYFGAKN